MRETDGELLVAQLQAAGIQQCFAGSSSGGAPIFDALVDAPGKIPGPCPRVRVKSWWKTYAASVIG